MPKRILVPPSRHNPGCPRPAHNCEYHASHREPAKRQQHLVFPQPEDRLRILPVPTVPRRDVEDALLVVAVLRRHEDAHVVFEWAPSVTDPQDFVDKSRQNRGVYFAWAKTLDRPAPPYPSHKAFKGSNKTDNTQYTTRVIPNQLYLPSLQFFVGVMATPPDRNRTIRTACDRCYKLKERCARGSITVACGRCDRLDLVCSTVRPKRPSGRRPRRREQSTSGTSLSLSSTFDIGTWLQDLTDLLPEERQLMNSLLCQPENLECYVVSPSFQAAEQQSLIAPLPAALPVLKDAYLACASALKLLEPGVTTEECQSTRLQHISSAMEILRSLPVLSSQDATLCLTLGTTLALSVYSVIGVGVADICGYCLSTTNPFMEKLLSGNDAEPWQSFLALLETMECIVHCRKPTVRIRPRSSQNVDRHLGLCLPLLPYYHDICVISYSLANTTDNSYLACLQKQLDEIQGSVEAWQPLHPEHFVDHFQTADVINLLAQARVYRLGVLLLSHRLRHVFGQQDSQAGIWAKEIMIELDLARQVTKRPIRCVTIPFIVGAVEICDPASRTKALQDVDKYVDQFSPVVQKAAKTFLSRIWHERDFKITYSWFDSVHKPCAVLQYIETASVS